MDLPEDLIANAMEEAEREIRSGQAVDTTKHKERLLKLGAHPKVVERHLEELNAIKPKH